MKKARILIVGIGGLGCPAAAYLVGAGVGVVGLVDGDTVEESNLHRQILHSSARVGMTKVESAMVALTSLVLSMDVARCPNADLTRSGSILLSNWYHTWLESHLKQLYRYFPTMTSSWIVQIRQHHVI